MKYKDKKCLVCDYGTLTSVALRLSQDFGKVFYYSFWKKDYNRTNELNIGEGFDEIEWVLSFWDCVHKEKPDLIVFTGILDGDLQEELARQGFNVWGCRGAEAMELYRYDMIEFMKEIGLPVAKTKKVKGIDALRKELYNSKEEKIIKVDSNERNNFETFKYICDPEATELEMILPLSKILGASADNVEFLVQDIIEADTEDGYDGYVIDGKFPKTCTYGCEAKTKGYIGMGIKYEDLPEHVKYVNDKLAPALKKYEMRGNFSSEIRVGKDGKPYLIDPTMRFPFPPTNCILDNWINMAECLYEGALGNVIDPVYDKKYVGEFILESDLARTNDYKLIVPDEIKEFVKIPYAYKSPKTGSIITIAQESINTVVGSVVARADTKEEVIKLLKERASQIEGYGLTYDENCLDELVKKLK